jgi:Zn-dependent M28 family amino/carboxypeptidase
VSLAVAAPASAATPTDTTALQTAVKVGNAKSGIRKHLKKLQDIADANLFAGVATRATGTPGHEASAVYVEQQLRAAGYQVSSQPFVAQVFDETAPPVFARVAPNPLSYVEFDGVSGQFLTMEFSGSGDVTGDVVPIDFTPPTNQASASTSGCEASDFPASVAGRIALMQRGTCDFVVKAENAAAAGAVAAIIFNEGTLNDADRNGVLIGTLGRPMSPRPIPVIGTDFATGKALLDLAATQTVTVRVAVTGRIRSLPTRNVMADTPGGRTDRTVVVGAHLDSVFEGPGINDDGSGVSTDLEVALQMARLGIQPTNKVRFIFFAGEEQGLLGSDFYVSRLTKQEVADTAVMLDFDMLASPNFARLVYDGDGSVFGIAGPNGSGNVEQVFTDFFASKGLFNEPIPFDGRSDYDAFTQAGIPAGGIFTGAEEHKTPAQQTQYGGTVSATLAGQLDPCYHLACDRYETNINDTVLEQMADAVAHSVLTFAQTTSAVNGTAKASAQATKEFDWKGSHLVR